MSKLIAEIGDELHQQLKVKAIKESKSIKQILINLITKYLKGE